jgi:hypothetical protein
MSNMALVHQVEQTARRGDQDVDAALQGLDLAAEAETADHHAEAQAEALAVGVEAPPDLHRQLTSRCQHQCPRALGLGAFLGGGEMLQQRQREGGRLAGAGLGDAQHVAALQQGRNGTRLDRRGGDVVGGVQGTQQRLGEAEIRKRNGTHWENMSLSPLVEERPCGTFPRAAGRRSCF